MPGAFPREETVGHNYTAAAEGELTVAKGDTVILKEANGSGWVFAELPGGKSGWIPESYIKRKKDKSKKKKKKKSKSKEEASDEGPPARAAPAPPAAMKKLTPPGPPPGYNVNDDDAPPARSAPAPPAGANKKKPLPKRPEPAPIGGKVYPDHDYGEPCGRCKKRVGPEDSLVAKGITFHGEHFRCEVCNLSLRGKGFLFKNNGFYCEEDYYETFNPKCGHCEMAIMGEYIKALGKLWHPDHFVCTGCEAEFEGNSFRKYEDMPYCEPCYKRAKNAVCSKCNETINGKVYTAMGLRFHLECFVCNCGNCEGEPIGTDQPFRVWEGRVMTVEHFLDLFRDDCAGCGKKIRGKAETNHHDGKKYHPGCWLCTCGCALTMDSVVFGEDGLPTCRKCEEVKQQAVQEAIALLQAAREHAQRQLNSALALMAELEKKARNYAHEREQQRQAEMASVGSEVDAQRARRRELEEDARRRAFEEEQKRLADEEEAQAARMLWEAQQQFDEDNENRVRMEIFAKQEMARLRKMCTSMAYERAQAHFDELDTMRIDLEEKTVVNVSLEAAQAEAARVAKEEELRMENLVSSAYDTSFSLEQLMNGELPDHIDRREKEMHLTDELFLKLFKMDKDAFCKMPMWRRNKEKKRVGLY